MRNSATGSGGALNPSLRVGRQVAEVFSLRGASRGEARERSLAAMREVHIADPDSVLATLRRVVADTAVHFSPLIVPKAPFESPTNTDFFLSSH